MDNIANTQQETVNNSRSSGRKWKVATVIFALLLLAVAGGGYYWYERREREFKGQIGTLEGRVDSLKEENDNLQPQKEKDIQPTEDEKVLQAAKNYCEALINPDTKEPRKFEIGLVGQDQKKVSYSDDKKFASLNVVCHYGNAEEAQMHSGIGYLLKKVNGEWIVIMTGQQIDPTAAANFGVPSYFWE